MAQSVRQRQNATSVAFSINNRVSEKLSRGMVYRELYLRLQGALTCTGANNVEANIERGDEWAVVKRIELIANGTDVLRSLDANALWWLNYHLYKVPPKITAAYGDAATANAPFDSVLILPLWMPNAVKPMDTALDSRELSSLEIAITWGTFTSINSAATAWTTEPTLEIYSLESYNVSGPFSSWRIPTIEREIVASNTRFQIQLPVGKLYRGFLINTSDAGVDQGDIMTRFKLISGSTVFADLSAGDDVMAQVYRLRNGLQNVYDSVGEAYFPLRRGDDNSIDGWYFYDHVTDGYLGESIDTLGFSEMLIEADVTVGAGATKMVIYPMEIVPLRGGANNAG
ncbi:hypothetical protein LCGC14_0838060 [marine sediment metagenome]|uniref:Viral coat protein P2 N-terminal domain-containing protein n=1 Tax=marine sediment metagenome TaxID=412755 RepID=A0A0F9SL88_9ZZZZ